MGYVFNNPSSVFNAFSSMTEKFIHGQSYEENEEFFLQGVEQLKLNSRQVDLNIKTYPGTTLKVHLQGQIPRFESGPFILQTTEKNTLQIDIREPLASQFIQMTVNGEEITQKTDSQLHADVYVPQSFKKQLVVQNREGKVVLRLPSETLYEIDLQSVTGKIENTLKQKPTSDVQPQDVGHISVRTKEGSILVEPLN